MKNLKKIVSIIIATTLSLQAWGKDSCEGVFQTRGLEISVGPFSTANQKDPHQTIELTLRLLQMTTQTLGEAFNKKLTLEKGELVLGQNLAHGWSIEYEYFADRRTSEQVFRLGKISLIKPNGEKMMFEKKPTAANGIDLNKKWYSEEEMGLNDVSDGNPFELQKKIEVPALIQGELLQNFLKFAPMMEYLKRDEINAAESTRTLHTKAFARSQLEYVKGIIKKQSFKFILIGIVMYAYYTEKDSIQNMWSPKKKDSWASIESNTDVDLMMQVISSALQISEKDLASVGKGKKQAVTAVDTTKALQQVSGILNSEQVQGGKAQIFILDSAEAKEIKANDFMNGAKRFSEYRDQKLLVNLPNTKRLLVLESGPNADIIVHGLDQGYHPRAYEVVMAGLQRHRK